MRLGDGWFGVLYTDATTRIISILILGLILILPLILSRQNWHSMLIIYRVVNYHCRGILAIYTFGVFIFSTAAYSSLILQTSMTYILVEYITNHLFIEFFVTFIWIEGVRLVLILLLIDTWLHLPLAVGRVNYWGIEGDSFGHTALRWHAILFGVWAALQA